MTLPKDPFMLYSAVNMKLRDEYDSLVELCKSEGIDMDELLNKLEKAGFEYNRDSNQFR
ncbi:MAG: DUF4250 domain-containing protein [Muribaculaceae bacterium]|nr:DUF4250 domain-containing protein [Muribaculaceae bacterium]